MLADIRIPSVCNFIPQYYFQPENDFTRLIQKASKKPGRLRLSPPTGEGSLMLMLVNIKETRARRIIDVKLNNLPSNNY